MLQIEGPIILKENVVKIKSINVNIYMFNLYVNTIKIKLFQLSEKYNPDFLFISINNIAKKKVLGIHV